VQRRQIWLHSFIFIGMQLLSQLESMSEEINDEVTRGKEILSEEDGEKKLMALLDEVKKNTTLTRQQGTSKRENKVCVCVCVCVCVLYPQM